MSERGRISVNALSQLLAQAGVLALGLVASPVLVHGLGLEAYGLLVIVGVATSYFGFVELGLGRATVQLMAGHLARGEHAAAREVLWTSVTAFLVLGLAGGLALAAAAPLLVEHVFAVSSTFAPEAVVAFVLGAASLAIAMQRDVAASVATAMERFDLVGRVTLAAGALQTVVSVVLVLRGSSLAGVMLGGLAVQAAALGVYWTISSRLLPGLMPLRPDLETLRRLVRFGGYVTVSQVVGPLLVHLEKVLIGAFAAVDQLPFYSVPYSLAWGLTVVPASLGAVLHPAMVRLMANQDHAGVRESLRRATRYSFVVLVGPVVVLVLYAPEILTVWMGAPFAARATVCLRILALAVLVNVLAWPSYQLLHAAGRADLTARYHVVELFLHVPVSIVLIARAGVAGAALAWLVRAVLDTALMWRAAARIVGLGSGRMARDSIGRGLLAAALLLPIAAAGRLWIESAGRAETAVALVVLGFCYVAPVAWLGLGREERGALLSTLKTVALSSRRGAPSGP
ncbi:MAG TPA: oligosaccharide flippase family protein [Vicinamibacteria bacterium]|nr:oligosaccharide flippase family protein [Vicinamibacteria bacterium]